MLLLLFSIGYGLFPSSIWKRLLLCLLSSSTLWYILDIPTTSLCSADCSSIWFWTSNLWSDLTTRSRNLEWSVSSLSEINDEATGLSISPSSLPSKWLFSISAERESEDGSCCKWAYITLILFNSPLNFWLDLNWEDNNLWISIDDSWLLTRESWPCLATPWSEKWKTYLSKCIRLQVFLFIIESVDTLFVFWSLLAYSSSISFYRSIFNFNNNKKLQI